MSFISWNIVSISWYDCNFDFGQFYNSAYWFWDVWWDTSMCSRIFQPCKVL